MLRRAIEPLLLESLAHFPAVLLVGARQVGKSTLVQAISRRKWPARVLTLDDRTTLDAALSDPDGFVRLLAGAVVIDEIQRAPDLLRAIKREIDRERRPGRFLLTGSANVLTLGRVSETLAGRVAVHELRPLSWSEVRETDATDLVARLFSASDAGALARGFRQQRPGDSDLKSFVLSGGYPTPALLDSERARSTWFDSYRQTYLERDLRDLASVANLPDFARLLTTVALRTAQLTNVEDLSRAVGMPATTVRRHLHLLTQTYQVEPLLPFATNLGKRLVKTPKLYFTDTGLACHLSAVAGWPALVRRNAAGAMLETWVHAELRKLAALETTRTQMSFWRPRAGPEVDFLLERGEEVVAIEVKVTGQIDRRDLAGLESCRAALGHRFRLGVLLHGGDESLALDERTAAIPTSLFFAGRNSSHRRARRRRKSSSASFASRD